MQRTRLETAACPVARSLDEVGDFWSLLLVRDAFLGRRRFGEFQKSLGLAKNILAARLRLLVERGIFQVAPALSSPHHEYLLTERGRALRPIIDALHSWGNAHCPRPGKRAAKTARRTRAVRSKKTVNAG
jgi:DNA-binding HxlR family transcriptional regulator